MFTMWALIVSGQVAGIEPLTTMNAQAIVCPTATYLADVFATNLVSKFYGVLKSVELTTSPTPSTSK